jgi:hypothetical protein
MNASSVTFHAKHTTAIATAAAAVAEFLSIRTLVPASSPAVYRQVQAVRKALEPALTVCMPAALLVMQDILQPSLLLL